MSDTEETTPTEETTAEGVEDKPEDEPVKEETPAATEDEPQGEEPPSETTEPPAGEEPSEPPVEEKPTEPPAEEKPSEPPAKEEPTEPPVEEKPTEPTPTETPAVIPITEDPAIETPAEETPAVEEPAAPPRPPRTKVRSTRVDDPVELCMAESGIGALPPVTIGTMFRSSRDRFPDHTALAYKEGEEWMKLTYSEYYDQCVRAAKSFLKLELEPYHSVGIIGFNTTHWFIAGLGSIMAGGIMCGIYATNNAETCQYILEDSRANIAVVENDIQLKKVLSVREQLPNLKAIVQYTGSLAEDHPDFVYEWDQFLALGDEIANQVVEDKITAQKPDECVSLVYTSGTTGRGKGVMLSHDNFTWTTKSAITMIKLDEGKESLVSYLPLSHIAAQILDIFAMMLVGGAVYFAQPDALKGTLVKTLNEVLPTVFFGVPRVWEKIQAAMMERAVTVTGMKRKIGIWAKGKGLEGNKNIQQGGSVPWGWTIADKLVFKKVKATLGLSRTKYFASAAAPLSLEVAEFFMSYNIPIFEVYGMSESTGPETANIPSGWRVGSCGKALPGVEVKIDNPDDSGEGEVCTRGRCIMMGYLNKEEQSREVIDDDGWLHSGDNGRIDKDGFLYITGRIKELIITSGGENVAPVPIEERIKKYIPFISNAMVIGDKRNYLTCLLTLKSEVDPDTLIPSDDLTPEAVRLVSALGSSATKVSQILDNQDRAVFTAIQEGIDKANEEAIARPQKVQKWTVLNTDFSIPGEELGPTLKLRRFFVMKKYAETIEGLYSSTE